MRQLTVRFAICSLLLLIPVASPASNKPRSALTLEGQVVCSVCWDEADRATTPYGNEADIQCAIRCAKRNIAQALAVMGDKEVTLYVLEPGKVKNKAWFDLIGKWVKITGTVREAGDKRFLKVEAIEKVSTARK